MLSPPRPQQRSQAAPQARNQSRAGTERGSGGKPRWGGAAEVPGEEEEGGTGPQHLGSGTRAPSGLHKGRITQRPRLGHGCLTLRQNRARGSCRSQARPPQPGGKAQPPPVPLQTPCPWGSVSPRHPLSRNAGVCPQLSTLHRSCHQSTSVPAAMPREHPRPCPQRGVVLTPPVPLARGMQGRDPGACDDPAALTQHGPSSAGPTTTPRERALGRQRRGLHPWAEEGPGGTRAGPAPQRGGEHLCCLRAHSTCLP